MLAVALIFIGRALVGGQPQLHVTATIDSTRIQIDGGAFTNTSSCPIVTSQRLRYYNCMIPLNSTTVQQLHYAAACSATSCQPTKQEADVSCQCDVGVGCLTALYPTAAPPIQIPLAPSNLVVTSLTTSSISLRWQDNSCNEIGFKLERCRNTPANCSLPSALWTEIAQPAANATTYNDTGLTPQTSYCYRIRSYNTNPAALFPQPQYSRWASLQ